MTENLETETVVTDVVAAEAGLYVVGTPIGNLSDMSPRACAVLAAVDIVACEDTRVSGNLLKLMGIKAKLISYHEHNYKKRTPELVERLLAGASVALISDAGMPCISDPGYELVKTCRERGVKVSAVPGPTAATTALAVSGLDSTLFIFRGFLSLKTKERKAALAEIKNAEGTTILYEAPHRLRKTLQDMLEAGLGDRQLVAARELTKRYEEVLSFNLAEAVEYYTDHEPRGEYVLLLAARPQTEDPAGVQSGELNFEQLAAELLAEGLRVKSVAKILAKYMGMSTNAAFDFVQEVKNRN